MKQRRQHQMNGLLALLLFGVFAACILSVLLAGAGAYRRLTDRDSASYDARTAAQYLATRVRQADAAGQVFVASFDGDSGSDTLFLTEDIGGTRYDTRVYCHDGYIRELFSAAGETLAPEDGEPVLEAQALTFGWTNGLLTAELTAPGGSTEQVILALRSREEAAP